MPSIKDLKKRIVSTKNTQQTTKAMKMVSAAKLRRATDAILSQRPYAKEIAKLMSVLSGQDSGSSEQAAARQPRGDRPGWQAACRSRSRASKIIIFDWPRPRFETSP